MQYLIGLIVLPILLWGCSEDQGGTTAAATAPESPQHAATGAMYDDRVVVHWDGVTSAEHYTVARRSADSAVLILGSTAHAFYVDSGLAALTTWEYRVVAGNSAGTSAPGEWVVGRTLPTQPRPPPSLVGVFDGYEGVVRLTWLPSPDTVTSYRIYRTSTTDSVGVPLRETMLARGAAASIPADSSGFSHIVGLDAATQYYCITALRTVDTLCSESEQFPAWPDYVAVAVP